MTVAPAWPTSPGIDLAAGESFRPRAFREFILKVHQRCNLACDYCYVYTMADQSWRHRPAAMSAEVCHSAALRIREHARAHHLADVRVVLHGGEPLLAGAERLSAFATTLRRTLADTCGVRLSLQTNGILLDEAMLDLLTAESIEVGVSLDGIGVANDRHRRYADGRGSSRAVDRALRLLTSDRYRSSFAGLLCTVDPTTDPRDTYEALLEYEPPAIDFLLPHANWTRPPHRPENAGDTPYGDWLVAVFDRWYSAPRRETSVKTLDEILRLILGGSSRSEHVGLSPVTVVVVESDGAIEQVDSLKSAYAGACSTGLNITTDSFDRALQHPGVMARQLGANALCGECRDCPLHRVCGAGHYAHRYSSDRGFLNRTVYCADLQRLITHVHERVVADLSAMPAIGSIPA
ncbi:FxsB family cyclophane-forming radical SAM/SPASM peptide maturase [Cryptosporangium aurantiacum]|uniref:Radical SAM core domain-containing protein n=1 Tax=Cryptosporangium aurantiacum TaxID=134849 RepID=A0A1M7R1V5_9ACTN|nr:FxsB family cyclophane-forming radical SAM/SPASM peptide maturase [Cryptosporangium aurantiacum]SHN38649.1 uncharacterized protein SAMN05443668_106112 [Cryptosporangium aurantiacum]